MKLTKKHWGLVGLVGGTLLFMLWLAGLLTWGKIRPGSQEALKQAAERPLLTVTEVDIPLELPVLATVMSNTLTHLSAQVPGRVSQVYVEAGSRVREGDPLVALTASEFQAKVAQAQAQVSQAQAQLTQVSADHQRYQRLLREGAVSPREFEVMEARYRAAQASLAQAQAQVKEAAAFKSYTIIRAPTRGVIAARPAAPGDLAQPGRSLVSLYDPAALQIEGEVNEEYCGFLLPGTPVRVEVPAIGWQGQVKLKEIFPLSAPGSRTFKVRTEILTGVESSPGQTNKLTINEPPPELRTDNPEPKTSLVPGMFARLYLPLGTDRVLLLPKAAVLQVGQLTMVEVLADGRLTRRQIKVGRQLGDQVEVLSGLKVGEKIALPEP
ncbi:MAG: efflux RND transporter periplasmic adaptor subunit [Desulfobaccales bacterium]